MCSLRTSEAEALLARLHLLLGAHIDRSPPPAPSLWEVRRAIEEVGRDKNGYVAWALYIATRQAGLRLPQPESTTLAGAMLNVNHALYGDNAAHRTLLVLDHVTERGEEACPELLTHAAKACALGGLAERAEALLEEHTRRRGFVSLKIAGSVIEESLAL